MTELREPPLLSDEVITQTIIDAIIRTTAPKSAWRAMCQAQREADIKWMKEHCYLKAKRELPTPTGIADDDGNYERGIMDVLAEMLKEVDGVAYRASREFKDEPKEVPT